MKHISEIVYNHHAWYYIPCLVLCIVVLVDKKISFLSDSVPSKRTKSIGEPREYSGSNVAQYGSQPASLEWLTSARPYPILDEGSVGGT